MDPLPNRRFNINTLLSRATVTRYVSTITIRRIYRAIKSRSGHLFSNRAISNLRSIILTLNVRIKNDLIRRMSKHVVRRDPHRNGTLTLTTKGVTTTLVRDNLRTILTTTRVNRVRLFRYHPRLYLIHIQLYRTRITLRHAFRSNNIIKRRHRNTRALFLLRLLRQRTTRHRTTNVTNTTTKRRHHGNTFTTTALARRQSGTTL